MQSQWSYADIPDQSGRVVLVTGANSGLGFHSARGLAAKGAQVLLASRSFQRGERAAAAIRRELPQAQVTLLALDLGDLESVKGCAETVQRDWERLDLLINNAGVMAIPRHETEQGFERQFGVNHLGHFVLTGRLLPLLLKTPDSRIVNVSSLAHRSGHIAFDDLHGVQKYSRFGAYSQSKLANLLFTFELQRRLDRSGAATISAAAHPGFSATNLPFAGPRENQSKHRNPGYARAEHPRGAERRAGSAATALCRDRAGCQRPRFHRTGRLAGDAGLSAEDTRQRCRLR